MYVPKVFFLGCQKRIKFNCSFEFEYHKMKIELDYFLAQG